LASVTRTEGISVRVIRMLCQLVGFDPVERANVKFMTRTEGIFVRVIRMLSQLVGFGPVERANVKSDMFFLKFEEVFDINEVVIH